ncbi:MAG: glycosyltransferase family 2 protein [Bacteroidetes bacterium]|nr:glycosyltransferase family 2 protein [Bacteroidota bacterium]
MLLSVIIVNYRVKHFLEICLLSVQKALEGIDSEIFVVDNASADGSLEYLQPLFPQVNFIANTANVGFARANNQALEKARGKYVLFLNPDTILPETAANDCLRFLESTPNIGGLGVRMLDGSGLFLKESRRGFPSPWVAFCKLSGLTALFPKTKLFAAYYLGHLPADISHPAPVLSGACFWVARALLEKTGGFDERYFMYAEDIDLSYRLEQAGYVNYYKADTTIIHFKGESTRKDTRYVKLFYKAMSQFRRKHFRKGLPALFNIFMEAAIWLRAAVAAVKPSGRLAAPTPAALKTYPTGDPAAIQQLLESLLAQSGGSGRSLVFDSREADELIFCEGMQFSFHACISALEAGAPYRDGMRTRFYAANSGAVVGSSNRDGQGEVLVIAEDGLR